MNNNSDNFLDKLVSDDLLKKSLNIRNKDIITESIQYELLDKYKSDGWKIDREFKTKCRVKKVKPIDIAFEDSLWALLANMGFKTMNRDRFLYIPYSADGKSTQKVNIFAVDDETLLVIECKATELIDKKKSFKTDIDAIGANKKGIINYLRKQFPNENHKIKFVFATKNYILNNEDINRLENFEILHFSDETLKYYQSLYEHLGVASKYQLLASVFEGEDIPELDNTVPAIKGKMGKHTYYSFSIEPERLLKIGFVLHRNKANKKHMPTYQRMIKKSRLRGIENFVNAGGYFPNSIVVNIDTKKNLRFDRANTQSEFSIAKVGILHLPKKYKSAYIIDGQHRLYGYANTKYKTSNSIPVVAFENLDRNEQIEIFMQINENQKAIPKNLKNTLNADLLWDSSSFRDAVRASKLQMSIDLGEDKSSPFYGKIIIGEDIKSKRMCITLDTISTALNKTNFYGKVTKDAIKEIGTFYDGNIEKTHTRLFDFLVLVFDHIKENLSSDWELGEEDNGYLSINATTYVLILLINDIMNYVNTELKIDPKLHSADKYMPDVIKFLQPVLKHFSESTVDEKLNYRKSYGLSGRTEYWHKLQQVTHETFSDFNPPSLAKYMLEKAQFLNDLAIKYIRGIEQTLKKTIRARLEDEFGKTWWKKGVPSKVYINAEGIASQKNREIEQEENEIEPWDCLHIIDYRDIINSNRKWLLEEFTMPGDEQLKVDAKTDWLVKFNDIRNTNVHSWIGTEDEIKFLEHIYTWLKIDTKDNDES